MNYLFSILKIQPRNRLLLLLPIVFFVAVAELISIYSIYPFFRAAAGEQLPSVITELFLYFGVEDNNKVILVLGLTSFCAVFFSGIMRAIGNSYIILFNHNFRNIITEKVLNSYLYCDYLTALKRNRQEMESSLFTDTDMLISTVFTPLTNILNSIFVLVFTLSFLVYLDFTATFVALTFFGVVYFVIVKIAFRYLRRFSLTREENNLKRYETINSILSLYKHIKINSSQRFYLSESIQSTKLFSKSISSSQQLSLIPKFIIESLGFGIILYYLINQMSDGGDIAKVAVFAFAGYRMMPLIQNIYSGVTQIKYGIPLLKKVSKFLENFDFNNVAKKEKLGLKGIDINSVSFAYSDAGKYILENATLKIEAGDSIGIVGTTGSGKSTLIDILSGLLVPSKGTVNYMMDDNSNLNLANESLKIAYVDQNVILENKKIRDNISDHKNLSDKEILEIATVLNLENEFQEKGALSLNNQVLRNGDNLSGGQKQRISILRAVCKKPEILILDEATSALDNETQEKVIKGIHNLEFVKIIISIAHRVEALNQCNKVYRVSNNRIEKVADE